MAQLTLLDMAKRNGSDTEIGLIEDVVTFAPELGFLPVRPLMGTSYKSTLRTDYPAAAFRAVGDGVVPGKSSYVQKLSECFYLDGQLQVDQALPDTEDRSVGDVLADELSGQMAGLGIRAGSQLYYGTASDANGFTGLRTFIGTSADLSISAAGTGTTTTTAYLVYVDLEGVHFTSGRTAARTAGGMVGEPAGDEPIVVGPPFRVGEWRMQQVSIGTAGKAQTAFVNNISGWLGLAYGSRYSAFAVRNISLGGTATYLTDALGQKLLSQVPLRIRNSGKLRWLMNRPALYSLQAARSTISNVGAVGGAGLFPDRPQTLGEVPIQVTDSITTTETAS